MTCVIWLKFHGTEQVTYCWTGWTRVAAVVDQSGARSIWKCKDSQERQFVKICMHLLQIL